MSKIIGLGGPFIKAKDPKALAAWYEKHLGIAFNGTTYAMFPFVKDDPSTESGFNILTFFDQKSEYFNPSSSPVMINFRVEGLLELLEELRKAEVTVVGEPLVEEYGKFGWILDSEGNKIELWEPPKE